jgi:hypothetical protein
MRLIISSNLDIFIIQQRLLEKITHRVILANDLDL